MKTKEYIKPVIKTVLLIGSASMLQKSGIETINNSSAGVQSVAYSRDNDGGFDWDDENEE